MDAQIQEVQPQVETNLAEAAEKFITGKAGDRFCEASIILGAIYVLWLIGQAVQFWAGVGR
jgi:hypothetical protein